MSQATALLTSIGAFQQPLEGAVRRWTQQIRGSAWKESKERAHRRVVLDLSPVSRSILDVKSCADNWPLGKLSIDDDELRARCEQEAILVGVETTLTGDKLWLALSDLALETARSTLLLGPQDAFPVSVHSSLTAVALANLGWLLDRLRSDPKERLSASAARFVLEPLELRDRLALPWGAGDLWIAMLAARTANRGWQLFASEGKSPPAPKNQEAGLSPLVLCQHAVPAFARHSALGKLIDAPQLATFVAQRAAYDQLPGLDVLTADPQAGAARRLLVSELAFNLATNSAGNAARGALLRWLQGLGRLAAELRRSSALNVAHFLWELLELDGELWAEPEAETDSEGAAEESSSTTAESLLVRLTKDKTVGRALREAITGFEQAAHEADAAENELGQRLVDVRRMLVCYEPYREVSISLKRTTPPGSRPETGETPVPQSVAAKTNSSAVAIESNLRGPDEAL